MELLDGFIVGIYNYCDRWCETCPFTGRCRVFATSAELDADGDPVMAALSAGLMRSTAAMTEALRTAASFADDLEDDETDDGERADAGLQTPVPAAHDALRERAMAYGLQTSAWLQAHDGAPRRAADAFGVVAWFHHQIGSKIDRALHSLCDAQAGSPEDLSDANGSAKVALLGAERSRAAWVELVAEGRLDTIEAAPFVETLTALIDDLEALVPGARAFVRPGFDEPEQVARLLAEER